MSSPATPPLPSDVAAALRLHAQGCASLGSRFYAGLLERMADDAEAGGPVADLLGPYAAEPFEAVYPVRLLGGVHRMVLAGGAPRLASHYPSTGGDGDAGAAWPGVRQLLASRPAPVLDALTRPPQTNEVGRSASLVGGMLVVGSESGLPLRLLEIGASAGLNLRVDRYRYEQDGAGWGDPASPVRFVDRWEEGRPPFEAAASIVERRGCDLEPVDVASEDAELALLSYVWPDHEERFQLLRAALDLARHVPVAVDRADAGEWLSAHLREPRPGAATVVFHSVVWQYLSPDGRERVRATLEAAGAAARAEAPLAWLRLEPAPEMFPAELRLTTWPGGEERLLATAGFHHGPVRWLV